MADKERWLAALLEKEPGAAPEPGRAEEAVGLYATASLVRGAMSALEVPESVQSQARARGLALLEQYREQAPAGAPTPSGRWGRFGSWLQVAFNLFRRR